MKTPFPLTILHMVKKDITDTKQSIVGTPKTMEPLRGGLLCL